MIILLLINFLINLEYAIVNFLFAQTIPTFTALTSWVSNISIPQTVWNIISLAVYFLPMGTIHVLIFFTFAIIGFKALVGLVHLLTLGKLF